MFKIDIIVPVYNSEETLPFLLDSILEQTIKPNKVIFGYNPSVDNTLNLLKDFQQKYSSEIIYNKRVEGPSKTRNNAVKNSDADLLAFTDSDCILPKNWIENILKLFSINKIECVTGSVIGNNPKNIYEHYSKIFGLNIVNENKIFDKVILFESFGHAANLIIKKKIYDDLNGFNENLFYGEDHDLCYRLLNKNNKIYFSNDINIQHIFKMNLKKFVRTNYNYTKSHYYLINKYSEKKIVFKHNNKNILSINSKIPLIIHPFSLTKKFVLLLILSFFNILFLIPFCLYILKVKNQLNNKFRNFGITNDNLRWKLFFLHLLINIIKEIATFIGFFKYKKN